MKKNLLLHILLAMGLCGCGPSHEGHNHDGHDHGHASHAGHNHGHEGHNQAVTEKKHNHEGAEASDAHGDEIVMSKEKAQNAGVKVQKVVRAPFRSVITTSGHLIAAQGDESSAVASMSGIVRMAHPVTEGMKVEKGETLFTITADNIQDGDPAERARVAYETAKEEYERMQSLMKDRLVTKSALNTAKERYENARIAYEAVSAGKTGKGVAVKAPISGYIRNCNVRSGDFVSTGQLLADIAKNNRLYLQTDLPLRHYKAMGKITSANFLTDYSEEMFCTDSLNGKILSTGRTVSEGSAFIPVTFEIDYESGLIAGSFVKVYLLTAAKTDVISLPLTAITEEQGVHFVYVQDDATCYHKQEVTLGMSDGNRIEILTGLSEGETVVTEGAIHVRLASASSTIPGHSHSH